ncbi:MAG: ABC transporter substrate-binding protein [Firmicutes bacterium]|nr:ABC transporter substrate-binding protein [Bacillota bacterium]
MKKRILAIVLSLAMLLSVAACGGTKPVSTPTRADSNEIIAGIAQDLDDSLNPYQMVSAGEKEIMTNVYEGLYKVAPSGDYIPAVAESYTVSEDGLVYTFKLRSGVKFHNGDTVTAADVLDSFATCKELTVDSSLPGVLEGVETTADGDNIVITLPKANNDFLAYVALVYIIPSGSAEICKTAPIGTGPFKFVSRSVQENVIFEKFADYWGEPAKLDKVTCKIYEDNTAMITALKSGAIDMAAHLSLDQLAGIGDNYNVLEGTMNLVQALYLNNARKPFDDVRVRQAICYAIDVDEILALTAEGHGTKLYTSIYPAFTKYFDTSLAGLYPHNTEKAKELLAEAGYADGFSMSVTVPSNYTPHVNAGQVIVQQLQAVGIKAELKEVEWNTWVTDVYKGRDFDSTVSGFDASTLTANALLGRWVSNGSKNMISFSNAEYDALIAKATAETDDAVRTQLYKDAAAILAKEAANAYIQDLAEFTVLNKNLSGYNFYPLYRIDFSTITY